jgi:signal peptidase I
LKANQADFLELSQELFERGALLRFRAHGRSMQPFIKNGNILIVEPLNGTSANIGDVVFYRRAEGSLTAHRLIKVGHHEGSTVLITRGDSLGYSDPPVPIAQVIGKVIRVETDKRQLRLNGWLGRPFGFCLAWLARGRYPNQLRLVRNLGRLWWLIGGK